MASRRATPTPAISEVRSYDVRTPWSWHYRPAAWLELGSRSPCAWCLPGKEVRPLARGDLCRLERPACIRRHLDLSEHPKDIHPPSWLPDDCFRLSRWRLVGVRWRSADAIAVEASQEFCRYRDQPERYSARQKTISHGAKILCLTLLEMPTSKHVAASFMSAAPSIAVIASLSSCHRVRMDSNLPIMCFSFRSFNVVIRI